ncbi:MAG: metal-sensitive transcriptional regulator [Anaerolineales bacterium]|nr:metal-sensitive transcriptional regulator [Anaerolineales bacterium]
MRPEERTEIVRRLRSAEGHLHAITGMVEDDQSCEQILHQLYAVQSAVQATSCLILRQRVQQCLDTLQYNPGPDESSVELKRLVELYKYCLTFSSLEVHRKTKEVIA